MHYNSYQCIAELFGTSNFLQRPFMIYTISNTYILIIVAYNDHDGINIFNCFNFSMQNIEMTCDLAILISPRSTKGFTNVKSQMFLSFSASLKYLNFNS